MNSATARPLVIAHRGASHDAPENTFAAFRLAFEQNADGIEADFHLTKDAELVCMHDALCLRTARVDRAIASMTCAEVRQLDVGLWKGPQFKGERVPTLSEVLAIHPEGKRFFIEIKSVHDVIEPLRRAIEHSRLPREMLRIISFHDNVLEDVKEAMPDLKTHWLVYYERPLPHRTPRPTLDEIVRKLERINADGLGTEASLDVFDEPFVAAIRSTGRELHVWTVDDPARAEHFAKLGINSITTNRPQTVRETLLHLEDQR